MSDLPARIGPYEVLSRLGKGGMAETYVALRRGPGGFAQRVCLKRIRRELERDAEFVRQFLAEAAIAARLRHAAIAQILDFGQSGEDYFMAFELIEGMDLRELLQAHPEGLRGELVLLLAIELATALDFAHRGGGVDANRPIVHRDVSPANTLLSLEGEVKLADFGIARALGEAQHTRSGIIKGKVPYVAPEYARTGRFDERSDLFSLGVLLYECGCGERPHDGATDLLTLERAARAEHAPLPERRPALPPQLTGAIERLLRPEPAERFASAGALLESLQGVPLPARTRRELGALVAEERRPRAELAIPQSTTEAHAPTASLGASERPESAAPTQPLRRGARRGPRLALALAFLVAGATVAFAALQLGQVPSVVSPKSRAPVTATTVASEVKVSRAPHATLEGSAATQARDGTRVLTFANATEDATEGLPVSGNTSVKTRIPSPAILEVVVLPYGEVKIDGKPHGTAPIRALLAPGEHVVESSSDHGTSRRTVTLAAGDRQRLILR